MADDEDPRAGEATTVNYGWTKPTVGASDDQWGGQLNADLDGIDSVVHGIDARPPYALPIASTSVLGGVKVDGTTIHAAGDGTLSGTPSSGPPVTISATAPVGPQVGALWWDSVGGQLYTYYNDGNSSQWVPASNAGASLQPASTTVLGAVKVDGTTIQAAADGTISTTVVPMGDNRLINGDMRIDQRGIGVAGTAVNGGFPVDRWQYQSNVTPNFNCSHGAGGPPAFPNCITCYSTTPHTAAAGDVIQICQPIEADAVSDFCWGTANAQPVTLSFWFYCNVIGTFGGVICNYGSVTRSYPFSWSYSAIGVWQKIVVTIPGDTSGTWVMNGNNGAVYLRFDLGSGSTYRGPAGVWASANYVGATGTVSPVASNPMNYSLTGVKLEIGSVATPFNRQSLAKSMADCQRYYQVVQMLAGGYTTAGISCYGSAQGTTMRATPTITQISQAGANLGTLTYGAQTASTFFVSGSAVATTSWVMNATASASAEL